MYRYRKICGSGTNGAGFRPFLRDVQVSAPFFPQFAALSTARRLAKCHKTPKNPRKHLTITLSLTLRERE
ncbi:MAG: hypothetical protein NZ852_07645 [SAR324 cluster bacterium]|nr:hypothetical protein [SAR324 cluster bacterium]